MFYCDKIRTYVLNLTRIEILISCILDKAENIGQYIGVGSDGSHDPPTLEIDMSLSGSALFDAKYWVSEAQQYEKSRDSDIELAKVNAMIALAEAVAKLAGAQEGG
jgi:hypothetical protein